MKWKTEQRKISDLVGLESNPRQMTEKQVQDLTASLQKFDLAEIPAVTTHNKILAGHQRLKIMAMLGRGNELIDVRVPDRELTVEEEREYAIRSNRNTGEWDWDALANDFDMDELTDWGFEEEELVGGENQQPQEPEPEVEFSDELLLCHNYVVAYFDNDFDWQVIQDRLGLSRVRDLIPRKNHPTGIGRVLSGKKLLELLEDQ